MIKIIQDFLPKPLFDYMQTMVVTSERVNDSGVLTKKLRKDKTSGRDIISLVKLYIVHPEYARENTEIYDKDLMPLFGYFNFYDESYGKKMSKK